MHSPTVQPARGKSSHLKNKNATEQPIGPAMAALLDVLPAVGSRPNTLIMVVLLVMCHSLSHYSQAFRPTIVDIVRSRGGVNTLVRRLPNKNTAGNCQEYATTTALHMNRPVITPRIPSGAMLDLFNQQVTHELEASQLYLSASIWCDGRNLVGMARFMLTESNDERGHALAMIDFANKRNIPIKLGDLRAPDAAWDTPEELWEDILTAEMENTQSLLALGDEAAKCNDHAVTTFLMPYHMVRLLSVARLL